MQQALQITFRDIPPSEAVEARIRKEVFAAEHARLWWRDGQRMLHHLAPDHATIISGKQIIWTSLEDGDEPSFGPYSLRISAAPTASISS